VSAAIFVPGRSNWLLFAHVAAAFVFFGAALTVAVVSMAATRARSESESTLLSQLAFRVDVLVLWPALVILVGAGAQLASSEDAYGRGWLRWGMILTGVLAVLGGGVLAVVSRRPRRGPLLTLVATLTLVLLVVVFWLMTAKPGFAQ
jgi:hypothetical protein